MSEETKQILELLKWHSSDDLKRVQTKFTKTANSIKNDAIHSRLSVLYTDKEIETLNAAAGILANTKSKIVHAKEVKKREEERLKLLYEEYKKERTRIINKHIDIESLPDDEVLIMYCCTCSSHYRRGYLLRDVEDLFEHPGRYQATINEWRKNLREDLDDKFHSKAAPDENVITGFMRDYKLRLRKSTCDNNNRLFERFSTFIAVKNGANVEMLNK